MERPRSPAPTPAAACHRRSTSKRSHASASRQPLERLQQHRRGHHPRRDRGAAPRRVGIQIGEVVVTEQAVTLVGQQPVNRPLPQPVTQQHPRTLELFLNHRNTQRHRPSLFSRDSPVVDAQPITSGPSSPALDPPPQRGEGQAHRDDADAGHRQHGGTEVGPHPAVGDQRPQAFEEVRHRVDGGDRRQPPAQRVLRQERGREEGEREEQDEAAGDRARVARSSARWRTGSR